MILFDILDEKDLHKAEKLYCRYKHLLFSLAYECLENCDLAEEAVQETFIRVIKHLDKITDIESGRTRNFLVIICRNISVDILRREKRIVLESEVEILQNDDLQLENIVISQSSANHIANLVFELDEKYKSVLYFKITFGFTNKEIADIMNVNEELIKKRVQRARKILLEKMREEELL